MVCPYLLLVQLPPVPFSDIPPVPFCGISTHPVLFSDILPVHVLVQTHEHRSEFSRLHFHPGTYQALFIGGWFVSSVLLIFNLGLSSPGAPPPPPSPHTYSTIPW